MKAKDIQISIKLHSLVGLSSYQRKKYRQGGGGERERGRQTERQRGRERVGGGAGRQTSRPTDRQSDIEIRNTKM